MELWHVELLLCAHGSYFVKFVCVYLLLCTCICLQRSLGNWLLKHPPSPLLAWPGEIQCNNIAWVFLLVSWWVFTSSLNSKWLITYPRQRFSHCTAETATLVLCARWVLIALWTDGRFCTLTSFLPCWTITDSSVDYLPYLILSLLTCTSSSPSF